MRGHSKLFYEDIGLQTSVADEARELEFTRFGGTQRVFWLNVEDGSERRKDGSTSIWNHQEVLDIDALLQQMEREFGSKKTKYSVGVIAAYGDQRDELSKRIRPGDTRWRWLDIRIATVDAFQGKEDDIILYSMVRTRPYNTDFISDPQRLNVAFSRAKRLLVIVGHRATAAQSTRYAEVLQMIPAANIMTTGRTR